MSGGKGKYGASIIVSLDPHAGKKRKKYQSRQNDRWAKRSGPVLTKPLTQDNLERLTAGD